MVTFRFGLHENLVVSSRYFNSTEAEEQSMLYFSYLLGIENRREMCQVWMQSTVFFGTNSQKNIMNNQLNLQWAHSSFPFL